MLSAHFRPLQIDKNYLLMKLKMCLVFHGAYLFPRPYHVTKRVLDFVEGVFRKILVKKGKNAGNQHFLLFSQYFLRHERQKSEFSR